MITKNQEQQAFSTAYTVTNNSVVKKCDAKKEEVGEMHPELYYG